MIIRIAAFALISSWAFTVNAADAKPLPGPLQEARAAVKSGDFAKANKILATEAEKGNMEAANAIGELTLAGRGGKGDPAEAVRWFQKAADAGHSGAMFNLSQLLDRGTEGIAKNTEKSRFLLRTSAEAGFAKAQFQLALSLEPDQKARIDKLTSYAEAREWLERAAAQEHPDALLTLVRYYDEGFGGAPLDATKAAALCLRATKAGSVVAMNEMGVRYQKGAGLPPDNVAAIGWLMLATQYDLPAAHVNLGACYENGNGVRRDFDQAGRHYAAAARLNFAPGEFLLGRLIEQGKGTKPNPVHAYVLYNRAAAKNHPGAAERRDALKSTLQPAQLEEAAKLMESQKRGAAEAEQGTTPPTGQKSSAGAF